MKPTLQSASREDLRVVGSLCESAPAPRAELGAEHEAAPETRREFAGGASVSRRGVVAPDRASWLLEESGMKDWYVFQADGHHIGPVSTELLARGIVAGKVPAGAHVGAVGDAQWWPLQDVSEISRAVEALRASGVVVERAPMPSIPPAPAPPDDAPTVRDLTEPE